MRNKRYVSTLCALLLSLSWVRAWADPPQFPQDTTFTTLVPLPKAIEGLTGDGVSNLYTGYWRLRRRSLSDMANQSGYSGRDGGRDRNSSRWGILRLLRHYVRCCRKSLPG